MEEDSKPTYTDDEIRAASEEIDLLVKRAHEVLAEAKVIANKFSIGFNFETTYAAGAWYDPVDQEWIASSDNC